MEQALEMVDIRRAIGEFLDPETVIACACVSHDWHASFIPFLWRSLEFGKTHDSTRPSFTPSSKSPSSKYPPIQALEQNKHLIQRLAFVSCTQIPYLSLRGCQQLTYLSLSGKGFYERAHFPGRTLVSRPDVPDFYTPWYYFRLLVQQHQSSLRFLSVQPDLGATMTEEFLEAVMGCDRLETLRLHSCIIRLEHAGLFWKAISKVEHLYWRGDKGDFPNWIRQSNEVIEEDPNDPPQPPQSDPPREPVILYTAQSPPPSQLRTLDIKQSNENLTDLRLFQYCWNLRRICWEQLRGNWLFPINRLGDMLYVSTGSAVGIDPVTGAIAGMTTWPRLEELEVLNATQYSSDAEWARIMESPLGQRLKLLKLHGSRIGPKTMQALLAANATRVTGESELGQVQERLGGMAIASSNLGIPSSVATTQWNRSSLTVLDLLPTLGLNSFTTQLILSKSPSLEVLRVGRIWYMDIVEGEEWVCKNLRELCISIDMTPLTVTTSGHSPWITLDSTVQPPSSSPPSPPNDHDQLSQSSLPPASPSTPEFKTHQRQVFERLSTLNRLNILLLHQKRDGSPYDREVYRTLDLTLAAGLNQLGHLKHLSSLSFTSSHQNMGWLEIQWMVQTWPGMRTLTGKFSQYPHMHYMLKRYLNQHHVLVFDP